MTWRRYRFHTKSVQDHRPLVFNPSYPWWCSSSSGDGESVTIVAYLPENEDLTKYWDDAYQVDYTEEGAITFTGRFPKPEYYQESEQ